MINIRICSGQPMGACSFYRTVGPFSVLSRLDSEINVRFIDVVEWRTLAGADILFLERPCTDMFELACTIAKEMNIKVWTDFDDDFFNVPSWNPAYKFLQDNLRHVKKCLQLSDIVTVTSPALEKIYSEFTKAPIVVIKNAFNDYHFRLPEKISTRKRIFWRGSETHRKDLTKYFRAMKEVADEFPEWEWIFMGGGDLWYITDFIKNARTIAPVPVQRYFKALREIAPSIMIIPLVFNEFNAAKSNIAWQEGTYAGACTVSPSLHEFMLPGVSHYKDVDGFKNQLSGFIKNEELRNEFFLGSKGLIESCYLLSMINNKRVKIARGDYGS